jgi:hypothetical protein
MRFEKCGTRIELLHIKAHACTHAHTRAPKLQHYKLGTNDALPFNTRIPLCRVFLKKLSCSSAQDTRLTCNHGSRKFITMSTKPHHCLVLRQLNPIQQSITLFLQDNFNILKRGSINKQFTK